MKPACTKICIVSNDLFLASLMKDYMSKDESLFISTTNYNNIYKNKDIYVFLSPERENIIKLKDFSGLKVSVSSHYTPYLINKLLQVGITIFYDYSVDIKEYMNLGLHFYIYQRGPFDFDVTKIVVLFDPI